MEYFNHDTTAATDPKIMQLRLECGGGAVDAYWYFIEQMHRNGDAVCVGNAAAMRVHCHTLCTDFGTLESWVNSMISAGLLQAVENGEKVISKRAAENIEAYKAKKEKASSAAKSRWENADAKPKAKRTQCKRNADAMPIKENKIKDSSAIKGTTNPSTSGVAAAEKSAPPAAPPDCPDCDFPMFRNTQTGRWTCPNGCSSMPFQAVAV